MGLTDEQMLFVLLSQPIITLAALAAVAAVFAAVAEIPARGPLDLLRQIITGEWVGGVTALLFRLMPEPGTTDSVLLHVEIGTTVGLLATLATVRLFMYGAWAAVVNLTTQLWPYGIATTVYTTHKAFEAMKKGDKGEFWLMLILSAVFLLYAVGAFLGLGRHRHDPEAEDGHKGGGRRGGGRGRKGPRRKKPK